MNSFLIYLKITHDFSSLIQEQHLNFVHFIKKINFTIEITKLIVYNSSTMEDKILDCIKNNNLISPGEFIGVAVSGGADSMALLNVLNENKENCPASGRAVKSRKNRPQPAAGPDSPASHWPGGGKA